MAHSIWQAIIRAHEQLRDYRDLLDHIQGVVFMGVPHRGADLAYWGTFVTKIIKIGQLGVGGNSRFVEALKKDPKTLDDISRPFVERAANLSIRTFYETEKMGNLLVSTPVCFILCVTSKQRADCEQGLGDIKPPE